MLIHINADQSTVPLYFKRHVLPKISKDRSKWALKSWISEEKKDNADTRVILKTKKYLINSLVEKRK